MGLSTTSVHQNPTESAILNAAAVQDSGNGGRSASMYCITLQTVQTVCVRVLGLCARVQYSSVRIIYSTLYCAVPAVLCETLTLEAAQNHMKPHYVLFKMLILVAVQYIFRVITFTPQYEKWSTTNGGHAWGSVSNVRCK